MPVNRDLQNAKSAKKDEFYTQLSDIEKEISHYWNHFEGKVVYCNCDDPSISNFFRYFSLKFEDLGLRKLITTCYKNQERDLFSRHDVEQAVCLEYDGFREGDRIPNVEDIGVRILRGDGDFRSNECIELLKQADIVVTNPPFSLFRKYLAQLIKFDKKFLIIGNLNAVSYKETFPLFKDNQVWFGASIKSGDREFGVPDDYPLTAANTRIDENGRKFVRVKGVRWFEPTFPLFKDNQVWFGASIKSGDREFGVPDDYPLTAANTRMNGRKFVRVKGVRWFTNLDYEQRHDDLILVKKYPTNIPGMTITMRSM